MLFSSCIVWANEYKYELFNENDGFTSSIIFSIAQDDNGFLWFGTGYNGLMRYDGKNVVVFKNNPSQSNSLPNDNAGNLVLDSQGNFWVGSWGGGAIKLDSNAQLLTQYTYSPESENTISGNKVQIIFEDNNNELWFGTATGGLNKFNIASQDFLRLPIQSDDKNGISDGRVWGIEQTDPGGLWLATGLGLNLLDKNTQSFTHFFPEPDERLSDLNKIRKIIKAPNSNLYLGTHNGVVFFDTVSHVFEPLAMFDVTNIGPIYSMLLTSFGEYWVSSGKGVFSFTDADRTLRKVALGFDDRCSQSLFQDKQGTIWLSCEGVGLYKITQTNIFKLFDDQKVKAVISLKVANDDSILVGTSQLGLHKWLPETNQFIKLGNNTEANSQAEIFFITQTSKGDIWYGNEQSLFILDTESNQREISPPEMLGADFGKIRDIETDSQDNIWVVSSGGIFIINSQSIAFSHIPLPGIGLSHETGNLEAYLAQDNIMWVSIKNNLYKWDVKQEQLVGVSYPTKEFEDTESSDSIYEIYIDSQQGLWISSKTGLYLVDPITGERTVSSDYFLEAKNRGIRFIEEDKNGLLWLVTPVGVSRFNPANGNLQNFDKRDGLPGSRLFYYPTARVSDGTIYLSSRDGISHFNPMEVSDRLLSDKTLLTNFEVLGSLKHYNVSEIESSGLQLDSDQTNIKFEFATLDLLNARQIQYSYFLEGFDDDWIENSNNSTATYTNLSGGNYVFRVRAKLKDKLLYTKELSVDVEIGTPFWKQWWMFVVYTSLVILSVYLYVQGQKKAVIELERQVSKKTADIAQESKKLAVANQIKTQFLANMSHEIRTPLTTVIGQAEAIICREVKKEDIYQEVGIIHDSSLYLLALLNDILDLTKIEENKFELDYTSQDLHGLLTNINSMFSMQAKVKGLSFNLIERLPTPYIVSIDGLRLKQILINLLSNALKFTPKGFVSLEIVLEDKNLVFNVKDSGIGINHDQLEQIFNSFTQGDSSIGRRFGGSGLGLHLSNQLAVLMRGSISVQSEVDKGSVFSFSMPVPATSKNGQEIAQTNLYFDKFPAKSLFSGKILLAEDHPDNRRLITRLLTKLGLTVYVAADGFEAIEMYKEHDPEIVLMDIQMPNMDGLQAYKALRDLGYEKPIIALTANAMKHEVEEYYSLGFDDYIQKPIDRQILISAIAKYLNGKEEDLMSKASTILGNVDMSDLASEFKASLVKELEKFIIESDKRDVEALRDLAHRLSGASHLFGFSVLSQKATTLENNVKRGNQRFDDIQPYLDELIDEIKRILLD
ncbi:MAG: signal transduction histidine kinase/ligand-binding sensor domain-containing protein [Alphaproteobacteria bacterium]|jgi:signal transduction histidine kinase/ligand-binding sensor domain-containing protein/CheY-like chemotaxis protein/HPt (histidine-containing phosphotransfer) domain-containing protein